MRFCWEVTLCSSLRSSEAYARDWMGSTLVWIVTCGHLWRQPRKQWTCRLVYRSPNVVITKTTLGQIILLSGKPFSKLLLNNPTVELCQDNSVLIALLFGFTDIHLKTFWSIWHSRHVIHIIYDISVSATWWKISKPYEYQDQYKIDCGSIYSLCRHLNIWRQMVGICHGPHLNMSVEGHSVKGPFNQRSKW